MRQLKWHALLVAGAAISAVWIFYCISPHLPGTGGMDSDSVIPCLMANARSWNPFGLYYWGQNRFGAWPFAFAWTLHRIFGVGWSARGLYWLLVIALASSVVPLRQLASRCWPVCVAAFLWAITRDPSESRMLVAIAQPYAWQISAVLWAWWLIRLLVNQSNPRKRRTLAIAAAVLCLLSVWGSPVSAVFLAIAAFAEARRSGSAGFAGRWLRLSVPVLAAIAGEGIIRAIHQHYVVRQHWYIQYTVAELDRGHIGANVAAIWSRVWNGVAGVPAVASIGAAWIGWKSARSSDNSDSGFFAVTCSAMAWTNLIIVILTSWARMNDYHSRYLAPSWVFWSFACVAGIARAAESMRMPQVVLPLVGLVVLSDSIRRSVDQKPSIEQSARARLAVELPRRFPDEVLFGCYWGTYAFVDATQPHAIIPVLASGELVRMPWTAAQMGTADHLIVSHDNCPITGTGDAPAPVISDQGTQWDLEQPRLIVDGPFVFSRYVRHRSSAL